MRRLLFRTLLLTAGLIAAPSATEAQQAELQPSPTWTLLEPVKAVSGAGPRTIREALKKSESNGGQADEIFVDARTSALSNTQIQKQLSDFFAGTVPPKTKGIIQQVTVLSADDTKVTWPPGYQGL